MKIGLYGGSFDPVHRGHLDPVREARRALGLDRVIYLPTARPPHKGTRQAPAWARFTMVELALLYEEGMFSSPFEMAEERPSYTVDTVDHFRRRFPAARLVLLLGADSWTDFRQWKEWRRIIEMAEIAVMVRPGAEKAGAEPGPEKPGPAGELAEPMIEMQRAGRLHFVTNPPISISSTALRRKLARGERPRGEVPPLVLDYIRKYRLYLPDTNLADDDPTR